MEKLTEDEVSKRVAKVEGFEYVSGYINSSFPIQIKCTKCGEVFERKWDFTNERLKLRCFKCNPTIKSLRENKPKKNINIKKDLALEHKKNEFLINRFTDNWYALAICICSDKSIGKALIAMRVKDRKTPERKTTDKRTKPNWSKLDGEIKRMLDEGLKTTEIAKITEINISTIKNRLRKLRGLPHA